MSYPWTTCQSESSPPDLAIRRKQLRSAFGQFLTGVTVVTTRGDDGAPRGFTANSFSSVSMEPALVLVCPSKTAESFPVFAQSTHFAVNILSEEQKNISQRFASKGAEKFLGLDWDVGINGQPMLAGAAAWFECAVVQRIDAGDHIILLGEVLDFAERSVPPLGFHKGTYVQCPIEVGAY